MKPKTIHRKNTPLSLRDMQGLVGGQIELAYDDGKTQIVCNDEGKMRGFPENEEATDFWNDEIEKNENYDDGYVNSDWLAGDVLILTDKARMD